jgi:hypothetical protein
LLLQPTHHCWPKLKEKEKEKVKSKIDQKRKIKEEDMKDCKKKRELGRKKGEKTSFVCVQNVLFSVIFF